MENKAPAQIQIEVPTDLQATYANFAVINHAFNEIVIDFAHIIPNVPSTRVRQRLVLTPYHARLLYDALGANLANYERRFGRIESPSAGSHDLPKMGVDPGQVH